MADDDDDEEPAGVAPGAPLYMTPGGHAALREEARRLWEEERPRVVEIVSWAAGLGDRSENADYLYGKRRLREIDRRLRFLAKRFDRVQVVDPATQTRRDRVFFGATVTYARSDDREVTVTIVGIDEADSSARAIGAVKLIRPALLGAAVGEQRRVRTPAGIEEIEIVAIAYPS